MATTHSVARAPAQSTTRTIDPDALAADLQRAVQGEVRFDTGSRGLYSRDASNYRQIPIGVVVPKSTEDVLNTIDVCRQHGAPILARGGGTSLAGQCVNVAVVIDFSKYLHNVLEIDRERRQARVQPGTILDHLRSQTEQFHLTFGPDPATHNHCTLGGMIGNNSCGIHSVMAGRTADNVDELDVVTYDGLRMKVGPTSDDQLQAIIDDGGRRGEIYRGLRDLRDRYADQIRARYPKIPRRVSGFNLDQLLPENGFHVARALVGTEGTCVLALEATLRLIHNPPKRALVVIGYPDVYSAGKHVMQIMEHDPIGLEGVDHRLVRFMLEKHMHPDDAKLLPGGRGWLLAEFGGETEDEVRDKAEAVKAALQKESEPPDVKVYLDDKSQQKVWEIRESGLGATAFVPAERDAWPGWEDSAVPPEKVGEYLQDLRKLLQKHGYNCSLYGHLGQGCVHTRIDFELRTREGLDRYRRFVYEAADLVMSYGGSFSGEHGDGQCRAELLPKMYGQDLVEAFRQFKSIWDPQWKMNPGKVVDAYRLHENLTLGTDYAPPRLQTHFQFPEDHGNFAHAALRCVGVGKCRRTEGGTMCPSYMVTREEKHTTRGRAHLLFEMLQGDVVDDCWQSDEVKDALDLCLACKGCKGDCPVNVDMATYKAEFLSHYYQKHFRPRTAFTMGLIYWWARLAAYAPRLVNSAGSAPVLGPLVKWVGGIARQRSLPKFAQQTFKDWFAQREPRNLDRSEVILWPDTFNNHFHPEIAKAAVDVLEHAGFQVVVPKVSLCCGRPLYDYGMLDAAKRMLHDILEELRPQIRRGVCLVGLEPSCLAVFRDELGGLFPDDEDARRLSKQALTLSEFLTTRAEDFEIPQLHAKALVHGHCHHKAIMKLHGEEKLLSQMGLDYEILESGCCGMAGSFGFEAEHYDVSVACGERALLPAVRDAADDTLIIADGFSCQEQIRQLTDRQACHLAQVLQHAILQEHGSASDSLLPSRQPRRPRANGRLKQVAFAGAAGFAAGLLVYGAFRAKQREAFDHGI
jgi:FAD/FMN-containing dehydrogenase/Fe-S oxidoreductase